MAADRSGRQRLCAAELHLGQVRLRFEQNNPTLLADKLNVDESKAQEITALSASQPEFVTGWSIRSIRSTAGRLHSHIWLAAAAASASYLIERRSQAGIAAGEREKGDGNRRFHPARPGKKSSVQFAQRVCSTLQAKAVLELAKENLAYYDHVLEISRDRFSAGDIAQIDLDRLELQRVQYESDVANRAGQSANREDSAAHAAERPDSDRTI